MLKHLYKYIVIIIIIIILSVAFTGTHSVQSVDDLAYAVALGIDIGTTKNLKVTFQFTMPVSSGEGGSGEASPSAIDSVEADSIDSAVNLMNTYVSKEINLSHCKIIAISEELAKQGVGKEINSLINKVQIRPDNQVVITACTAEKYLNSVSPSLENLVTKFYEILPRSSEYTGYTISAQLGDFFNKLVCKTCQPTATLGNITQEDDNSNSSDSGEQSKEESSGGESGGEKSSKAISAKNGIENLGVAVFKDDKLVGKLTAEETLAHLLVTRELKSCNISVPDPENEENKIDLYLIPTYVTKNSVSIINGTPYIETNLSAHSIISSVSNICQKMTEERLDKIEDSASNYLENLLSRYLYRTSKEFHSDIAGFGKYSLKEFKTMKEFQEYDWLNHYQDAFFKVDVKVDIDSGFLLTGT